MGPYKHEYVESIYHSPYQHVVKYSIGIIVYIQLVWALSWLLVGFWNLQKKNYHYQLQ